MKILNVCTTIFLFLFLLVGIQSTLWAQVDTDGDLNADVTDPWPNDPNQGGVYAGATITYDVLLAGDLNAAGHTGTVITIAADGVTFNGNRHKIIAPDAWQGIAIQSSQNVILTDVEIIGTNTGLYMSEVTNPKISGFICIGPGNNGISTYNCTDMVIKDCRLSGRGTGIGIAGSNNTIQRNDCSQCYFGIRADAPLSNGNKFLNNNCSESNWGLKVFAPPAEITDNDLSNCSEGSLVIHGYSPSFPLVLQDILTASGNVFTDSALALYFLYVASGTTISDLDFTGVDVTSALRVSISEGVQLSNLTLPVTGLGLHLREVTNSTISGVTCVGTGIEGIYMHGSADNVVKNCTFSGRGTGIDLAISDNNQIYNNNFINNTNKHVSISGGSGNILNRPAPVGGNYWGRSCPGPLFVAGVDASPSDLVDNLPYATLNGWLGGGTPGCNQPPVVGEIIAPIGPVAVNTEISVSADFTDPDVSDIHTAVWDWDDDNTSPGVVTEENGSGTVGGSHTYTTAGVYTITLTVTDDGGAFDEAVSGYVVVHDPSAGFVTGGGWINSPSGAYADDPALTGKADFGFVSKYKKGAMTPSGRTRFSFRVADMNFHSEEYQWLLVAGSKAKFKGDGTINDAGNFGFMLSAVDAALTPSTDVDLFRIKIWDKGNNDVVVYDNQMGEADDADASTQIGGGSIVIHKDGAAAAPALVKATSSESQLDQNYPNPFNPETWIPYRLKEDANVTISIYSTTGRLVRRFSLGHREAGSYTSMAKAVHWDGRNEAGERASSGIYFYTMQAGEFTATKKMIIAQ